MYKQARKDCWDKLKIVSNIISGLLLPAILLFLGYKFNATLKTQEINAENVRLATKIISNADSSFVNTEMRVWAISILKKYSPVQLTPRLEAEILGVDMDGPTIRFGKGFGGGILLDFKIEPRDYLYLYVDGVPRSLIPHMIEFNTGKYVLEWRDTYGNLIILKEITLSEKEYPGMEIKLLLPKKRIETRTLSIKELKKG